MRTEFFVPGYTQQAFSQLRASLYHGASEIPVHNTAIKYLSSVAVEGLVLGTRLVDHPIRMIEITALTVINLVGSISNTIGWSSNEGFENNMPSSQIQINGCAYLVAIWSCAAAAPPLALTTMVAYAILYPVSKEYSTEERGDRELLTAYTIKLHQKYPKLTEYIPLKPSGNTKKHLAVAKQILNCDDESQRNDILLDWRQKLSFQGFSNALRRCQLLQIR